MSDTKPFRDLRSTYGLSSKIDWDDAAGTFSIITEYEDVQPHLDLAAAKRSAGRSYYARDPDMWRVASIPISVDQEWLTKFGVDFRNPDHLPKVLRLLNSPDYRYLKTAEVIV